jgi:hypothetical protein
MNERPWFRTRSSGLGWTPITWEGWLVTLAPLAAGLAINMFLVAHLGHRH